MAIMKQEDHHHRPTYHYNTQQQHLHSVQQSSRISKKPLPIPASSGATATQPKVYKVKPIHFRELVQQLTGAQPQHISQQQAPQQQPNKPQTRPQRRSNLHVVTPGPLPLHPHQLQLQLQTQTEAARTNNSETQQVKCKVEEQDYKPIADDNNNKLQNNNNNNNSNGVGTTELILSPNFQAWFSFAMMSPGSAAALSQM